MAKKKNINRLPTYVDPDTGKETRITPELIEKAAKLYRLGATDANIAAALDVTPWVFREWLARGQIYGGACGRLYIACANANSSLEIEMLDGIRKFALGTPAEYLYKDKKDADGNRELLLDEDGKPIVTRAERYADPKWAAWFLEKKFKKHYARELKINGDDSTIFDAERKPEDERDVGNSVDNPELEIQMMELYISEKKRKLANS